jgi:hypothetical protein
MAGALCFASSSAINSGLNCVGNFGQGFLDIRIPPMLDSTKPAGLA